MTNQDGMESTGTASMLTLTGLASVLLRQRRTISWCGTALCLVAIVASYGTARYIATASFTPATPQTSLKGVAQFAQAFGVDLGSSAAGGPSLDFYVAVLRSRELLTKALLTPLRIVRASGDRDTVIVTPLAAYGIVGDSSQRAIDRGLDALSADVGVSSDPSANLVTIRVRGRTGAVAEGIARRLLQLVNEFNVGQLQSAASAQRRFIEGRWKEAHEQLRSSEDSLRSFLERNRSTQGSPMLLVEQQRLQRAIELRQQIYVTLAQALEQARIGEVRNTPVITIVDVPEGSARRRRHMLRNGAIALIVGLAVGVVLALGREHLRRERESYPDDFTEFMRLREDALAALRLRKRKTP